MIENEHDYFFLDYPRNLLHVAIKAPQSLSLVTNERYLACYIMTQTYHKKLNLLPLVPCLMTLLSYSSPAFAAMMCLQSYLGLGGGGRNFRVALASERSAGKRQGLP